MSLIDMTEVDAFLQKEDFLEWRSGLLEYVTASGPSPERAACTMRIGEQTFREALLTIRRVAAAASEDGEQSEAAEMYALNLLEIFLGMARDAIARSRSSEGKTIQ